LPILWFAVSGSYVAFGSGAQSTSFKSYGLHKSVCKTSSGENSAFDGMSPLRHFHLINCRKMIYSCCMILPFIDHIYLML
jgi:hypothetical protein